MDERTPAQIDFAPLTSMFEDMERGKALYRPSPFWDHLIRGQKQELKERGLGRFKRTINTQYFSWEMKWIVTFLFIPVLWQWVKRPRLSVLSGFNSNLHRGDKAPRTLDRLINRIYGLYVVLLKNLVERDDELGLLKTLEEPLVGDPIFVVRDGHRISQDLCNSVHELYSSTAALRPTPRNLSVAELGAGYGRLGYVFLKAFENCQYTIIDIPPALFVAQSYLSEVFRDKKIFRFRPFSSYDEIREEFEQAQIRFVAAHQIELLPDQSVDLFLNISSLHEMTLEQIQHYFAQIARLTRSCFYTKQWKKSRTAGMNPFRIGQREYPVPAHWQTIYHKTHPIHPWFFHALYRCRPNA